MGRNWEGWFADSTFGRRTRNARLILESSIYPSWKEQNRARMSGATVSQKVEKKEGPKSSGPGLDSLFMPRKASLISSAEKGLLRWAGRGGQQHREN
jgi:hypothetical protein